MRRGGTEKGKGISPSKFGQLGEPAGNRILESHHILLHERILDLGNTDFHDGLLGEKKKSKEKKVEINDGWGKMVVPFPGWEDSRGNLEWHA